MTRFMRASRPDYHEDPLLRYNGGHGPQSRDFDLSHNLVALSFMEMGEDRVRRVGGFGSYLPIYRSADNSAYDHSSS